MENAQDRRRIAPIRVLLADDQPLYLLSKAADGSVIVAELTRPAPAPPPLSERTAA